MKFLSSQKQDATDLVSDMTSNNLSPKSKIVFIGVLPFVLLIIAMFETFQTPFDLLWINPLNAFRMLMLQSFGIVQYLWPILVSQTVLSALAVIASRKRLFHTVCLASSILCLATGVGWAYKTLIEYNRFSGYIPFILIYVFVFLFLTWWIIGMYDIGPIGKNRFFTALVRFVTPIASISAFALLNIANYLVYYDAYPTLHLSVLQISFLLLHAGLSGTAYFSTLRIFSIIAEKKVVVGAAFVVVFVLIALGRSSFALSAEPIFLRFTVLGQYAAQYVETGSPLSFISKDNIIIVNSDPDGVERFKKYSNMPSLPNDFSLEDYNILNISIEATRFQETSFGNKERNLTPNLAKFAEDESAFVFTRAYSGSSYTVQSFSSLFRMMYPSASGVHLRDPRWDGYLDENLPTAPGLLSEIGYDNFWRPYSGGGGYKYLLGGFSSRFKDVEDNEKDEQVLQSAMKAISKRAKSDARFFGWVFFSSPHTPYLHHFDDMPKETILDRYRQEIRYVDGIISRLIEHVKKEGLLDKTIIIIHGDHGEELNEHGKVGHHSIYDVSNHVLLLIRVPGMKGTQITKPTSLIYIYPWLFLNGPDTLKQYAVTRLQENIGPMMKETDGAVVVEIFGHYGTRSALVYDQYSLFYDFSSKFFELYDNKKDPKQKKNIYNESDLISAKLKKYFDRYLQIHYAKRNITFESGNPDAPETDQHRNAVTQLIKSLNKANESTVIELLSHEDWRVRQKAATVAGEKKIDDSEAVHGLILLLADSSKWVRRDARNALRQIGMPAASVLIDALRQDSTTKNLSFVPEIGEKEESISVSIKMALKSIGPEVIPVLIDALDSEDIRLIKNISGVLGLFGTVAVDAVPNLIKLTGSDKWDVRNNVIADLAKIAPLNPEVKDVVKQALNDSESKVRKTAQNAMKRIEKAEKSTKKP